MQTFDKIMIAVGIYGVLSLILAEVLRRKGYFRGNKHAISSTEGGEVP